MTTIHSSHCNVTLLHAKPARPRLYKAVNSNELVQGFSVSAHLRDADVPIRSSRQERSHVLQRCSATEVQITEDARQNGAQPPNPPSPPKPEEAEPSREEAEPSRERTEDWPLAQKMLEEQKVHDFQVVFVNRGGVRGDLAGIEAFMPFSKMCTGLGGLNAAQYYKKLMSKLPGLNLRVKVVLVEPDTRTMILSEREAIMDSAIHKVQPGSVVTAVVRNLVPYGAFVSIKDPETGDLSGGHGLLHISDMSWDQVGSSEDVVSPGDTIQCKIKAVDKAKRRIYFSLKLMEDDPLTQTLDQLFSPESRDQVTEVPVNIPQGVKDICAELEQEEGIESVVLGRQVEEKRVVSQDLELWIAKERLEDGYNLITRAGRTVQELKVTTDIPLDVMKSAVQTVLRRLA